MDPTPVAVAIQGTVTTASPVDWGNVAINALFVLVAGGIGIFGAWWQRDATLKVLREQFRAAREQRVRDERARTAGVLLQQARIRAGIYERLVGALDFNREDLARVLAERLFAVDAESDDLLQMSVEHDDFRAAVQRFLDTHGALRDVLLDKARQPNWSLKGDDLRAESVKLLLDVRKMQQAADTWIASPA